MKYNKNTSSDHSVGPDILTGWHQRSKIQKFKQLALRFANQSVDLLCKSLTSFGNTQPYRVVYMGQRFTSNLKAYKRYSSCIGSDSSQGYLYGVKSMKKFSFAYRDEKEKYFPILSSQYRVFTGINPTLNQQDIIFDSDFECGNLDMAICVSQVEYDLIMRVDSNTRGHTSWFFFKVSNFPIKKKIKFNIINFRKKNITFKQGKKPYVFRQSQAVWTQQGLTVSYHNKCFRYESNECPQMQCLSFTYQFDGKDSQVFFAYCIPYSYSYLLHFVEQLTEKYPQFIKVEMQKSSGAIEIPILTITNFTQQKNKSKCICISRLHPGQSQGSWIIDGFIRFLCSPAGHILRQTTIFKIIPMVNVDGVILGNYRTCIIGRDLNRVFHRPNDFQQISIIRNLASQFNPIIFLDFHGHSTKKNVFIYGPQYRLQDRNYIPARFYPKAISLISPAFRYYSCSFKIIHQKRNTGRAIMFRQESVPFSYTIQASCYSFGNKGLQTLFTSKLYQDVGTKIALAFINFNNFLKILQHKKKNNNITIQKSFQIQNKFIKHQTIDLIEQQNHIKIDNQYEQQQELEQKLNIKQFFEKQQLLNDEQIQIIKQILKIDDIKQEINQSDNSDCQDQSNDYNDIQLELILSYKYNKNIINKKKIKIKSKSKSNFKQKQNNYQYNSIQESKSIQNNSIKKNQKKYIDKLLIKDNQQHKKISNKKDSKSIYRMQSNLLPVLNGYDRNVGNKKKIGYIECRSFHQEPEFNGITLEERIQQVMLNWDKKKLKAVKLQSYDQEYSGMEKQERKDTPRNISLSQQKIPYHAPRKHIPKSTELEPLLSIKKSIFPMLGSNFPSIDKTNVLNQMIEHHERKALYTKKNIKILY